MPQEARPAGRSSRRMHPMRHPAERSVPPRAQVARPAEWSVPPTAQVARPAEWSVPPTAQEARPAEWPVPPTAQEEDPAGTLRCAKGSCRRYRSRRQAAGRPWPRRVVGCGRWIGWFVGSSTYRVPFCHVMPEGQSLRGTRTAYSDGDPADGWWEGRYVLQCRRIRPRQPPPQHPDADLFYLPAMVSTNQTSGSARGRTAVSPLDTTVTLRGLHALIQLVLIHEYNSRRTTLSPIWYIGRG